MYLLFFFFFGLKGSSASIAFSIWSSDSDFLIHLAEISFANLSRVLEGCYQLLSRKFRAQYISPLSVPLRPRLFPETGEWLFSTVSCLIIFALWFAVENDLHSFSQVFS